MKIESYYTHFQGEVSALHEAESQAKFLSGFLTKILYAPIYIYILHSTSLQQT